MSANPRPQQPLSSRLALPALAVSLVLLSACSGKEQGAGGTFHLLHNPAGRGKMLDLESHYKKMLAHCDEYLDSTGDSFLNLASTVLGLNAYALTGEEKYRQ